MGLQEFAEYLVRNQEKGWKVSDADRLAGYFNIGLPVVTKLLDALVDQGILTTNKQDQLIVDPRATVPSSAEAFHALLNPPPSETHHQPNPIQVIPLLTNMQAEGLLLGQQGPLTEAERQQGAKESKDIRQNPPPRHDPWIRDQDA